MLWILKWWKQIIRFDYSVTSLYQVLWINLDWQTQRNHHWFVSNHTHRTISLQNDIATFFHRIKLQRVWITLYNIRLFGLNSFLWFLVVPPSPPYIRIVGCSDTVSSCQKRGREGKIVCKVSNVFPNVTLQPSTSTPPDRVKFTNIIQKEDKNGDNYDITLVFNYTVGSTFCNVDVPITCIAVGEPALTFPSQRDVFVKG